MQKKLQRGKIFTMECYRDLFEGKIPMKAHVHRADDIFTAIRIADEFGNKQRHSAHRSHDHQRLRAAEAQQEIRRLAADAGQTLELLDELFQGCGVILHLRSPGSCRR